MIKIIFEAHGTTFDNEAHLSSGHNDVALSPLGIQQSKEMGERYKDARLRECNYGDLTQHPSPEVDN